MTPTFHAGSVRIEDNGEYLLIGLVDDEFAVGDYLMLQRLGMDKVYIERNDQAHSSYGGIERFELFPSRVRIRFDTGGAQLMAGIRDMEVSFPEERYEALRSALEQCFKGFSCYSAVAAQHRE